MSDGERQVERFRETDKLLPQLRRFWSAFLDALERHLDRMGEDSYTRIRDKTRRKK